MRLRSNRLNPLLSLAFVLTIALSHVAVLGFVHRPEVLSNVLQLASAFLALGYCLNYAWRTRDRYLRQNWLLLGSAFALWSSAQSVYFYFLITNQHQPPFPSLSSILYFLVAFPILMVTVVRRSATTWEWVTWLDSAQACIFFFALDALLFSRPSLIPVSLAYDVQCIAFVLTGAMRYSSADSGAERVFFRNTFLFLALYGLLVCGGIHLEVDFKVTRAWLDLCWSTPFLIFCALSSISELMPAAQLQEMKAGLPRRFQGLSALGLTVLSIAAGIVLELHHTIAGIAALAAAFLLFAVRTSTRESQLHTAHDTLEYSVLHDALTGLANRRQLLRELEERLRPHTAHTGKVALLFIDLDRFKTINDGLGHAFGDRLLIAVAQKLTSAVHAGDLVARLGGDEFVIMTECADLAQARVLADAVVQQLRTPLIIEDRTLHVTASTGIVLGEAGMDPDELLRSADCAMYASKDRGRNQATVFEASMAEKANGALHLETDLREALDAGGISVQYQPIYSLTEQAVIGFEALARWQHRTRGWISPGDFIPIAEDCGLIVELGQQVLRQACRQVQQWNKLFDREFYVSVNVSSRQFDDELLLKKVKAALSESALPPSRLKLEVTESVLLTGVQPVRDILDEVRAMGVEIALDDFGTGYSSLSYLLRFPFDLIKIDRSFVQALDTNAQRADLAGAIVQIAANLGKKVIAEGVETESELRCLQGMRCDLHQGYLFSKPLAPEVITRLLSECSDVTELPSGQRKPIWAAAPPMPSVTRHFAQNTSNGLLISAAGSGGRPAYTLLN